MNLLTLIVLLPLAGFLLNGLAGPRLGKGFVSVVGCGLPILAFLATVRAFMQLDGAEGAALVETAYTWAVVGDFSFDIAFYFDRLSALMTLIVTGVGSLIHIYSTGYMKDDASYARYFSYLNLFLFFMLLLVLGRSLLVCFVGWEGVGLASYLLIGRLGPGLDCHQRRRCRAAQRARAAEQLQGDRVGRHADPYVHADRHRRDERRVYGVSRRPGG